ncbi:MAG: hypothetical protein ABSG70_06610 [Terriglobales bacterium]|jgi:hypothetical protein
MPAHWAHYGPDYIVFWIQLFIAFGAFVAFALAPSFGEVLFRPLERFFRTLSSKKTAAFWILFLATMITRLALLPAISPPRPDCHDEHSYVLMGEMFASGHLSYPPHPLWKSFETFNENFYPTYSSIFPPAQGAVLAFGDLLGHPWIGVLLSVATMSAATFWMLQAYMPPQWAFLGAVMAFCNLGIVSYWMNSYWGGAVAAIGGAIVLGSIPRIFRTQKIRYSILLGLGVAILANSRPYEGLLFCIPVAGALLVWLFKKSSPPWRTNLIKVVLPVTVILCLNAAFMGYYNWRTTGDPLLMPHDLNLRIYFRTPLFIWQHARPPIHYNNQQYENYFNGWVRSLYDGSRHALVRVCLEKMHALTAVFLWPGALAAMFTMPLVFRDRRVRLLLLALLFCLAGIFCVVYSMPHYAAPLTCVIYGLLVQSVRHLRTLRAGSKPIGLGLARAVVVLLIANTGLNIFHLARDPAHPYLGSWNRGDSTPVAFVERLERMPGQQLIMVRYRPTHNFQGEWVYNHADIDASHIVWARELDAGQNAKLFAYYKNRQVWLFEPDRDWRTVSPYPAATLAAQRP